jgi:hypothetical protein
MQLQRTISLRRGLWRALTLTRKNKAMQAYLPFRDDERTVASQLVQSKHLPESGTISMRHNNSR